MATYLNRANFSGSNGPHFYIELQYDLLSQNTAENYSIVRYYLYLGSTDGYHGSGTTTVNCYINGNLVGTTNSIETNSRTLIGTRDETINHNSSGACSPSYSASSSSNWSYLGNASLDGTYSLPTIPRYFTQTPKISISSATTTSATFTWNTSENCNWVRYHLDNSSSWIDVFNGNTTSATFTINNLGPRETHTIYIECRRSDSGLWSNSKTISFTTSSKTLSLKANNKWNIATPYLKVNNMWKVVIPYIKINGKWKRGK